MSTNLLPPGSIILVSGVNGFIGSHIADQAIKAGYRVRGTVRDAAKQAWLVDFFDARYGKGHFELVEVKNLVVKDAFSEAIKGASGFAHCASDTSLGVDPKAIITPAIEATINALEAASSEPGLKSFVLTSSSATTTNVVANQVKHLTTSSWNEEDVTDAWKPNPTHWNVYCASKVQSEQAAWNYVKEKKPNFTFNAVLPNVNFGEIFDTDHQPASTAGWIRALASGVPEILKVAPPQYFISVEDDARLHVGALMDLSISRQRILGCAAVADWTQILDAIVKVRPALAVKVPKPENDDTCLWTFETTFAEKLLKERFGKSWDTLEEAIDANLKGF